MEERREFLKKLAKGTAYAAPLIYTLSTPRDLMAIVTSGMMSFSQRVADPLGIEPPGSQPPWSQPAPGSEPPGSQPPGSQSPSGTPSGGGSTG